MQMVCATYVYCVQYGVNHKSDVCMLNKPPVLTYHSRQTCCTHTHASGSTHAITSAQQFLGKYLEHYVLRL